MVILSKAMAITGLKAKLSVHSANAALRPYTDAADVSDSARSGIADCLQSGIVSEEAVMCCPEGFHHQSRGCGNGRAAAAKVRRASQV